MIDYGSLAEGYTDALWLVFLLIGALVDHLQPEGAGGREQAGVVLEVAHPHAGLRRRPGCEGADLALRHAAGIHAGAEPAGQHDADTAHRQDFLVAIAHFDLPPLDGDWFERNGADTRTAGPTAAQEGRECPRKTRRGRERTGAEATRPSFLHAG